MRLQASPSTFTVDALTWATAAAESVTAAGGGPMFSAGWRALNTCGNELSPTSRRKAWRASGGRGKWESTHRAMDDWRDALAGQPGTTAMDGSSSHNATITPTMPT